MSFITSCTALVGPLMSRLLAPGTAVTLTRRAVVVALRLVIARLTDSAKSSARLLFNLTVWITFAPSGPG